jgi:hypothetical protein
MNISETIKALPECETFVNSTSPRDGMVLLTDDLQRLVTALEAVEYELSHGDLIAGDVTRFSVKDGLLKQVREALGK